MSPDALPPSPRPDSGRTLRWALGLVAAVSFLLVVHNFGINLLPDARLVMNPAKIHPYPGESKFAYTYNYRASLPDVPSSERSRARLLEDGRELVPRKKDIPEVVLVGGGRWMHEPGRIIFSTIDNSDPRTNGRTYTILAPVLYTRTTGRIAAALFLLSVGTLAWWQRGGARPAPRDAEPAGPRRLWWMAGPAALLLVALYANTGTLAPYGNTYLPYVDHATGYVYNVDHPVFRVVFDFVNGADRSVWDNALLLRRILHPVLAWPAMRLFGFEVGGTIASMLFNLAGFVVGVLAIRRHVGERGAVFAAWILALAPGATYWGGLPYSYALIFPGSLVLMAALLELGEARGWRLTLVSLGMGILYLGYDFGAFFLPASLLLLLWLRRWKAALVATVIQVLPTAIWLLIMSRGLGQELQNSNSGAYGNVLGAFRHPPDLAAWWSQVSDFADIGFDVFFGSNFIFIPALFLGAFALNPITSRVRFCRAELVLLATGVAIYLVNNLAPAYGGWQMRGTWISRLYQPILPALILFAARWWEHLPPLGPGHRNLIRGLVAGTILGNALIAFGPIADNPLKVSEYAFYKFYNHIDAHFVYESTLHSLGRRPLGFPQPQK